MKKNVKKTLIVVASVVLAAILAFAIFIAYIMGYFKTIPQPEIREGEFNFSLTYEVDGKTEVIDGVYVCEYDGIGRQIDGMSLQWDGYIKGHEESCEYEIKTTDEGTVMVDLNLNPKYFMADPSYVLLFSSEDEAKPEAELYITSSSMGDVESAENEVSVGTYEGDDVKIISFEYDQPIENIYK